MRIDAEILPEWIPTFEECELKGEVTVICDNQVSNGWNGRAVRWDLQACLDSLGCPSAADMDIFYLTADNQMGQENMTYDAEADTYTCANGKTITFDGIKKNKSQSGFEMETSVYSCKDCAGCPLKEKCIRACGSKKPMAERSKVIYVSKRFARQRETMEERINTAEGKLIRVNRSIQAEGVFAMVKEDMGFRRFLLRSAVKVEVE